MELASMFKSYVEVQQAREERMDKERARDEQRFKLQGQMQQGHQTRQNETCSEATLELERGQSMGWREHTLQKQRTLMTENTS